MSVKTKRNVRNKNKGSSKNRAQSAVVPVVSTSVEKKRNVRNKSKNRNKSRSQSAVVPVISTSQSVGEQLQSAVHTLQCYGNYVDLRSKAHHWVKLATQVLSNPVTQPRQVSDASSAALLLLHLLERCSSSSHNQAGDATTRMQLSPQLLLPCARAAVLQTGPQDLVNLPCLLMFRQLLPAHPGLCSPIKDQLEHKLKGWLNMPPEAILEDRLHAGSSKLPRCHLPADANINDDTGRIDGDGSNVALAADVWAVMPLANMAGAAGTDIYQSMVNRTDSAAVARGKQLKQLLLTVQHTVDGLLGNIVQSQGSESLSNQTGILLLKFVAVSKFTQTKKNKNLTNVAENGTTKMEDEQLEDDISDPLEMVELSFNRCCGLLVFVERLLVSVAKGASARISLVTRDVLLPLFRILQVSSSALYRYHSAEVQKLAKMWPALQHRALHTLHAALLSLGPHLFSWYHLILDQLTNTLLAVPNAKTASATPKAASGSNKTADASNTDGVREQLLGLEKLGHSWDVVAQQETVRLIYLCLNKLAIVSRNMHGTPLPLAKAVFADLSPQPNNDATLQIPSKKSIASMNIRKKSKSKGYTISTTHQPPSITLTNTHRSSLSLSHTSSSDNTVLNETLRQPFANVSLEKSAQIISNALDLLRSTITCDQHYVLSADTATLVVGSIVRLARTYCDVANVQSCRFYPSASGLVDLRALLGSQQLMAKLFRLLPLLVVHLHPAFPPPAAELLFILREGARIHAANEPVSQACEDGVRQIGSFLSNPSTAAFLENIEKMKISEYNKCGLAGEQTQNGGNEDEDSDEEIVADDGDDDSDGGDGDDGSEKEEDDNFEDTETANVNGVAETEDGEQLIGEVEEEVSSEETNIPNQSEEVDCGDDNAASESADGSINEGDDSLDKENQTPDVLDHSASVEEPLSNQKSAKKRRTAPSEEERKLLKKKRKVSVSGKTKVKKAKRCSSVANVSASETKVECDAGDSERENGDLSVADMLSELLD